MLWLGVPPLTAMATGKFQAVFGTLSSSINYFRRGFIDLSGLWPLILFAAIAGVLGTYCVLQIGNQRLQAIIPYFLIGISLFTWFSPSLNNADSKPVFSHSAWRWILAIAVGFYGGFFGPGVGTIAAIAFSSGLGYQLLKATAHAKPVVLAINLSSVGLFLWEGQVWMSVAICMAIAQVAGAYFGSNMAIEKGAKIIKPLLVLATMAIAINLLFNP